MSSTSLSLEGRNDMFKIKAMDHIVLNVPDIDRALAFYVDVLGLEPERLDEFRRGEVRFPPCASARRP
jgi:catechol 2,3-dioxygenase-like lactoylglutathione lyase family enzyme